jgi:hypothetical protein
MDRLWHHFSRGDYIHMISSFFCNVTTACHERVDSRARNGVTRTMGNFRSIWHSLVRGLVWGGIIAVANLLIFPVLFELHKLLEGVLYGWGWPGLAAGLPEGVWWIYLVFGFRLFFAPSVIGGCVLSLILHFSAPRTSRQSRQGLWVGGTIGGVVALSGLYLLLLVVGSRYWILEAVMCIVEIIIYAWIGRRMALSYRKVEKATQSMHLRL